MNKQQLIFWKSEREMLDRLYLDRMREWQRGGDQGRPHRLNTRSQELEVAENGQAPELEQADA